MFEALSICVCVCEEGGREVIQGMPTGFCNDLGKT